MADRSEESWWRKTKLLAVTATATGGLASVVAMLLAPAVDKSGAAIPSGWLIPTLLAPLFILLVIFWAADRQRRIDRTHGFYES